MNYFIFNFNTHNHLIDSFLKSSAEAHGHEKVKTQEWFYWKFKDNPFGKTILACAEEKGEIAGCVAYGFQDFKNNGRTLKGVMSFETFVHPNFQGRGIFSNLIKFAEATIKEQNVDLMLNFPNSNSLRGFLKSGWKQIESPEYRIKGNNLFKFLFAFKELKKGFLPNVSNLKELKQIKEFSQKSSDQLHSVISTEYLNWRFFTYPVSEYVVINNEYYQSIIRMGKRGNLREGQVLFLNITDENAFRMNDFLKKCKEQINYDFISFSITQSNPIHKRLKRNMFIKVPNRTNICYKIINQNAISDEDMKSISLSAINYHTY